MKNMELWERAFKTDPKSVKKITGKQYNGNSPNPYYIVRRLTEEFGPIGIGWGFDVENERFERLSDTDVLHVAKVRLWHGDRSQAFDQMGQTKACYMTNAGKLMVDEDAPKKSVTDALVKCASYLGFAGDIFSGRWDDSKYVAELAREFSEPEPERSSKGVPLVEHDKRSPSVAQTVLSQDEAIPDARKTELSLMAHNIAKAMEKRGADWCAERLEEEDLADNELIYLSTILDSTVRNKLKTASQALNARRREEAAAHV